MSARDLVLGRVRAAIAGAQSPPVPRGYRQRGEEDGTVLSALFRERVGDYRAEVQLIERGEEAPAIAALCASAGARRLVIPAGLPLGWRPPDLELVEDAGLSPRELDATDGVISGCSVAIAETGTIVLTAAPHEGRRAITLVPDLHICLVEEERIVAVLPEALARIDAVTREGRPVTFISGPSATSDIELDRVEGVHGPRRLVVLVLAASG